MNLSKIKKEIARDVIALGSPIFFLLVVARIFLLSNYAYLSQFIISGILFFPIAFFSKPNYYSGLGLVVLIFTTKYYGDLKFALFGAFIYLILLASLVYLKEDKIKILKGIFLGLISTGISYYAVNLFFN